MRRAVHLATREFQLLEAYIIGCESGGMADALDLGSSGVPVGVRVPPLAPLAAALS